MEYAQEFIKKLNAENDGLTLIDCRVKQNGYLAAPGRLVITLGYKNQWRGTMLPRTIAASGRTETADAWKLYDITATWRSG